MIFTVQPHTNADGTPYRYNPNDPSSVPPWLATGSAQAPTQQQPGTTSISFNPSPSLHQVQYTVSVSPSAPQWGAADAEIKVPSGENTELKHSPFQAWSRSVYSHTCYAYCRGVLPCLFLPFQSIHLHFFQNLSQFFFLCWPAE